MNIEYLDQGSPDCPLIRIFGTKKHDFRTFIDGAKSLSDGTIATSYLHEYAGFYSACRVTMKVSDHDLGLEMDDKQLNFTWALTPKGWWLVCGLIEPFANNPAEGSFQWLSGLEARFGLDVGSVAILLSYSNDGRW